MADFKPSFPFNVAIELLIPTYTEVKTVRQKTYPETGIVLNCSFKTYGGTESVKNGVYSIVNTATVETWYRPDIKANCRIRLIETGEVFEIIGRPENIDMRHQFCRFKVKSVEGGA